MTSDLESVIRDLVVANRILGNENVVDAYGHVSIRHPTNPERYFLSCSRSPELVERDDIDMVDICAPNNLHLEIAEAASSASDVSLDQRVDEIALRLSPGA